MSLFPYFQLELLFVVSGLKVCLIIIFWIFCFIDTEFRETFTKFHLENVCAYYLKMIYDEKKSCIIFCLRYGDYMLHFWYNLFLNSNISNTLFCMFNFLFFISPFLDYFVLLKYLPCAFVCVVVSRILLFLIIY